MFESLIVRRHTAELKAASRPVLGSTGPQALGPAPADSASVLRPEQEAVHLSPGDAQVEPVEGARDGSQIAGR
ncbi:hypothetical protein GCM10010399_82290 [Dactylosporangium fulvum]